MQSYIGILALASFAQLLYGTSAYPQSSISNHLDTRSDHDTLLDGHSTVESTIKSRDSGSENNSSTGGQNDGGNADGDRIAPFEFAVPNSRTTIRLVINPGGSFSPDVQRTLLNSTWNFIHAQFAASGDGQIPQAFDPFFYDLNQGCYIHMYSLPHQHLTWGIMSTAVAWLYKHLGEQAQYRHGSNFWIRDSDWGAVGLGTIEYGYSGKPLPQIVAGPAGVTNYDS